MVDWRPGAKNAGFSLWARTIAIRTSRINQRMMEMPELAFNWQAG
jgi:hypothetical protein